ncbi:MAG TPA: hypothetical protein VMH87_06360 [Pseudomonadales bacterium]|nr:hypothetical protein [Pseudomonadales bacterium]
MKFGPEHIDLSEVEFIPELLNCIPAEMTLKFRVMPVYQTDKQIGIATADPGDLNSIDVVTRFLNRPIEILVADKSQLDDFIHLFYGAGS